MLYQDHARLLVEVFRKILMMLEAINSDDSGDLKGLRGELEELYERSHELRGLMVKELREVGPPLPIVHPLNYGGCLIRAEREG